MCHMHNVGKNTLPTSYKMWVFVYLRGIFTTNQLIRQLCHMHNVGKNTLPTSYKMWVFVYLRGIFTTNQLIRQLCHMHNVGKNTLAHSYLNVYDYLPLLGFPTSQSHQTDM